MKTIVALIALILAASLAGCSTLTGDLQKAIPNGTWKEIDATVTGKFSATKFSAAGVVKTDTGMTAEELHVRHSNAWVPLIEFNAIGYSAGSKGKP